VTVGEQESIIDRPIVLYRGDREVEIEFTLVGNEFTFSEEGNVIKSVNASHGQLVLNTPSGEHMFSELAECHEGKVVFVVTKEMIDEFIEMGFYSFQIRLYDSAEVKSRVTIPPVMNGFDIRNPIAAEDETNVVDQGIVDYARIFKDQSNEELPTFTWDGVYNKTEWVHHDVITENKLNKIEDAIYSINANIKESDVVMLNALDNVKKDADAYVKEHMAEVEADVDEFERNLNTDVQKFKIDTNAAMTAHKNEVSEVVDGFDARLEHVEKNIPYINLEEVVKCDGVTDNRDIIQNALNEAKTVIFPSGVIIISKSLGVPSNTEIIMKNDTEIRLLNETTGQYNMLGLTNVENVSVSGGILNGNYDNNAGNQVKGYGIAIRGGKNININNVSIKNCTADGIMITNNAQNVIVENIDCIANGRNGMSISGGKNIKVNNCKFSEHKKEAPRSGLVIEPYYDTHILQNIEVTNLFGENNDGKLLGINISFLDGSSEPISINASNLIDKGSWNVIQLTGRCSNQINGNITLSNLTGINNKETGLYIYGYSVNCPLVSIDNVKIVNCASSGSGTEHYASGIAIFNNDNFGGSYAVGNINIKNIDIIDNRDTKLMRYAIYVNNSVSGENDGVSNVYISDVKRIKGQKMYNPIYFNCKNGNVIDTFNTLRYEHTRSSSLALGSIYYNPLYTNKTIGNDRTIGVNNAFNAGNRFTILIEKESKLNVSFGTSSLYPLLPNGGTIYSSTIGSRLVIEKIDDAKYQIVSMIGNWEVVTS
jgi:hypothetical protein